MPLEMMVVILVVALVEILRMVQVEFAVASQRSSRVLNILV